MGDSRQSNTFLLNHQALSHQRLTNTSRQLHSRTIPYIQDALRILKPRRLAGCLVISTPRRKINIHYNKANEILTRLGGKVIGQPEALLADRALPPDVTRPASGRKGDPPECPPARPHRNGENPNGGGTRQVLHVAEKHGSRRLRRIPNGPRGSETDRGAPRLPGTPRDAPHPDAAETRRRHQ